MLVGSAGVESVLFGPENQIGVDRGLAEFRSGRPVLISAAGETLIALPVDGLTADRLAAFAQLCAPAVPQLTITARRARTLGLEVDTPVGLKLGASVGADTILSLVTDAEVDRAIEAVPVGVAAAAALDLAKLAESLPAVLAAPASPGMTTDIAPLVAIAAEAVGEFRRYAVRSLKIAAEADVPLQGGLSARFVVFSDAVGGGAVAVLVGKPDPTRAVPVRLHSACLTGDVFGSRRCDCGDQLRLSLALLAEMGGGIVLYLAQEGRGLGLANKMRAYQLQDAGLDTIDANTTLGFDDDERGYEIAARMLEMLGCHDVLLLTNNPAKVDGLAHTGITVSRRIPLVTPINPDNRRYLNAKATRAGHQLDHVLDVLTGEGLENRSGDVERNG